MLAAAQGQAAHVAEHLLDRSNADAERELALDILNDYVDGLHVAMYGERARGMLAWALKVTEGEQTWLPHEAKLRELAWAKVREDADTAEWERMADA